MLSQAVLQEIINEANNIIDFLAARSNGPALKFIYSIIADCTRNLMKMSCAIASLENRAIVEKKDIEVAAADLKRFLFSTKLFCDSCLVLDWTPKDEFLTVVNYLLERRAVRGNTVSKRELVGDIAEIIGKPSRYVERVVVPRMRDNNFIKVKRGRLGGVSLTKEGYLYAGHELKKDINTQSI